MVNTLQLVRTHIGARHWLHIPAIDQRFPLVGSDLIVSRLRLHDRLGHRIRPRRIPLALRRCQSKNAATPPTTAKKVMAPMTMPAIVSSLSVEAPLLGE